MSRLNNTRFLKPLIKQGLVSKAFDPFRYRLRGRATVLCYHRLTDLKYTGRGFYPNIYLCVRSDNFAEQMRHLAENSELASINEIVQNVASGQGGKHKVGITFDDGYRDNLELALPILEKFNIPATIFVSSGLIDRSASVWWEELGFIVTHSREIIFDWDGKNYRFILATDEAKGKAYLALNRLFKRLASNRQEQLLRILRLQSPIPFQINDLLLTWEELQKLAQHPLITLGCHTVTHPILSNETEQDVIFEMTTSRKEVESKISKSVDLFAYPVGGIDEAGEREFALASKVGFKAAFTTRTGHIHDKHKAYTNCLPRITMDYFDSMDAFKWKLSGFSAWLENGGKAFVTD